MIPNNRQTATSRRGKRHVRKSLEPAGPEYVKSLDKRIVRAWYLLNLLDGVLHIRATASPDIVRAYDCEQTYWSGIGRCVSLLTRWVAWTQVRYDGGAALPGAPVRAVRDGVDLAAILDNERAYLQALIAALEARKWGCHPARGTSTPSKRGTPRAA